MRRPASLKLFHGDVGALGLDNRLLGDGIRLRHLPIDLHDRRRKLIRGRGDIAHIGRRFRRGADGAFGAGRGAVRGRGKLHRGFHDLVADGAEIGDADLDRRDKRLGIGRQLLLLALARVRVLCGSRAVELQVVSMAFWKMLIERDSAPISSRRDAYGIVAASPLATAVVTRVICASGRATARHSINALMAASSTATALSAIIHVDDASAPAWAAA